MLSLWLALLAACNVTVENPCPKGYTTNDQVTISGTVASFGMLSACTAESPCTGELTVTLFDSNEPDAAVDTEVVEDIAINADGTFTAKVKINSHEINGTTYGDTDLADGYYDAAELSLTILDANGDVVAGDLSTIDADGDIVYEEQLDDETCSSVDDEMTVDAVFSL